ncbi:MAG: hypothetical protein ACRD5Z_07325, partial [Bryobacteraceae bacterium]
MGWNGFKDLQANLVYGQSLQNRVHQQVFRDVQQAPCARQQPVQPNSENNIPDDLSRDVRAVHTVIRRERSGRATIKNLVGYDG